MNGYPSCDEVLQGKKLYMAVMANGARPELEE